MAVQDKDKLVSLEDLKTAYDKLDGELDNKVDKETGKGLSTNDYTTADKNKLSGIEAQANKTVIDSTLTQTGQAADAKAAGDAVSELRNTFNSTVHEISISFTGSTTSEVYVRDGDTVHFDTQSFTGSGWTVFPVGNSSDSTLIWTTGEKTKTYSHDGYLRFYTANASDTISVKCYIVTRFDDSIGSIEGDISDIQSDISDIQSDISDIQSDITDLEDAAYIKNPVTGHFNFTGGSSAVSSVKLTSGVTYTIKNITDGVFGGLVYIEGHSSPSKEFPANGNSIEFTPSDTGYLKLYKEGLASGTDVAFTAYGTDVYDADPAAPTLQDEIDDINETLGDAGIATVYEVGTGKQYTSFVTCINALPATGNKIVYVYPGEYDIYEEMGGDDFVSSLSTSSIWYNVNPIIPPNTKVIGIGRVLFKYNCPDNIDDGKAVLLSCLNIRGSATIENINIECKNLRYAVHVEGSANSDFNNSKYEFINCHFIRNNGTYRNACFGIGLNYGCEIRFDGCTIDSETTNGNSLLIHGNVESLAGSEKMTVKNCVFLGDYISLQLLCRYNSLAVIPVNIYNTYLQALIYKTTSSGQTCDDEFSLTLVGCNNVAVTNGNSIVNLRDVHRYNTIGN